MRQPRRTVSALVFLSVVWPLCGQICLAQLVVSSPTDSLATISMKDNTTGTNYTRAVSRTGNNLSLWAGGSERVTVLGSNGRVGIATTSPSSQLDVHGTATVTGALTVNGGIYASLPGGAYAVVSVDPDDNNKFYRTTSSLRYKTAVRDLEENTDAVLHLRPVHFNWVSNGRADIGLIAEEVDTVLPDLVLYDKERRPDAVKYDKVPLYLLQVVRTQQSQIATLEEKHRSEITALEERLKTLEEIVARMSAQSGVPAVAVSADGGK